MSDRYDQVEVRSGPELRAWLAEHHASSPGIWLVTYKKGSGEPPVPYDAIVCEALCYGWVDSRTRGLDARRSQLLLTPRKPRSGWSRSNKARVARLLSEGRMMPAGLAAIEVAKANGAWSALDGVEALIEPQELARALDAVPSARGHWDAFPRSAKRAILEWVAAAKRPETRERRIAETVRLAADNLRANEWRPKRPSGRGITPA